MLPSVMVAYRTTSLESTLRSQNTIMFGRENCMPIEIVLGAPDSNDTIPQPLDDYVFMFELVCLVLRRFSVSFN